jgi:hypothetical protein
MYSSNKDSYYQFLKDAGMNEAAIKNYLNSGSDFRIFKDN